MSKAYQNKWALREQVTVENESPPVQEQGVHLALFKYAYAARMRSAEATVQ